MKSSDRLAQICFLGFVLTSFWTHTIAPFGTHPIFGRIVWADLFGLGTVAFFLIGNSSEIGQLGKGVIWFLVCLIPGVWVSIRPVGTFLEIGIIAYLAIISIAGSYTIRNATDLRWIVRCVAMAALLAAFFGAYENTAGYTGAERLFEDDVRNYKGATFRNSGQAGTYLMICLSLLVPMRFSNISSVLTRFDRILISISIAVSVVNLVMTVKIAAFIGLGIGATGFALLKRKVGFIIPVLFAGLLFMTQREWLADTFPTLAGRMEHKVTTRLSTDLFRSQGGFLDRNYSAAMTAFWDNPLFGSGLFGFHGRYDNYEVHSTPLKLIGETGLLGCLGYFILMKSFGRQLYRYKRFPVSNPYQQYLAYAIPFVLGCCISFIYTWHLRKREFWIMVAVLTAVLNLMRYYAQWKQAELEKQAVSPKSNVSKVALSSN